MTSFTGKTAVEQKLARLERLLGRAKTVSSDEIRADLARLTCVQLSGLLEHVLYDLLLAWAEPRTHPHVQRYLEKQLEWFQNPKSEKIAQLLGSFDDSWRKEYELLPDREVIDSVVDLRNSIAHGENTGVSLVTIDGYLKRTKPIIDWLIAKLDP